MDVHFGTLFRVLFFYSFYLLYWLQVVIFRTIQCFILVKNTMCFHQLEKAICLFEQLTNQDKLSSISR